MSHFLPVDPRVKTKLFPLCWWDRNTSMLTRTGRFRAEGSRTAWRSRAGVQEGWTTSCFLCACQSKVVPSRAAGDHPDVSLV